MNSLTLEIDEQLLDLLETKLGRLAARWRGTADEDQANAIVIQYQSTLLYMIELGFHESLDVDAELPNKLMPHEYFDLFK